MRAHTVLLCSEYARSLKGTAFAVANARFIILETHMLEHPSRCPCFFILSYHGFSGGGLALFIHKKCAGIGFFFAFDNGSRISAPLMTAMPETKVPRNTLAPPPALGSVIVCSVACGMHDFYAHKLNRNSI